MKKLIPLLIAFALGSVAGPALIPQADAAVLTEDQRKSLWSALMSTLSADREAVNVTKPELRAAVDAVDSWIDSNMAALNTAIPQPARSSLTTKQKARLLMFVVKHRYEVQ